VGGGGWGVWLRRGRRRRTSGRGAGAGSGAGLGGRRSAVLGGWRHRMRSRLASGGFRGRWGR